jgi:hypothetical protein
VNNAAGWGPAGAAEAARIGVTSDRIDLEYGSSQASNDALVSNDAGAGLRPLMLLSVYTDLQTMDQNAFAGWAAQVAARYGPGGSFWQANPSLNAGLAPQYFEVINEPYGNWYFNPPTPAGYAQLFIKTAAAGRAANSQTKWLLAAGINYQDQNGQILNWNQQMLAAVPNLASYADGITSHPYGPLTWSGSPNGSWALISAEHAYFPTLPVWITEVGVSAATTGLQQQAAAVTWYVQQVKATPWIAALYIFEFADSNGAGSVEDNYGLTTWGSLSPLPAYSAYQAALG